MYDIPRYEIGDIFNNRIEVRHNAICVEIMADWVDEDGEVYYIIKCREVFEPDGSEPYTISHSPWMFVEEVKLADGFYLYKYFEKEN